MNMLESKQLLQEIDSENYWVINLCNLQKYTNKSISEHWTLIQCNGLSLKVSNT